MSLGRFHLAFLLLFIPIAFSASSNVNNCKVNSDQHPIVIEGQCDEIVSTPLNYSNFQGFSASFSFNQFHKGFVSDHDIKIMIGDCNVIIRGIDEEYPIFVFKNKTVPETHNIIRGTEFELTISKEGQIHVTDGDNQVRFVEKCVPNLYKIGGISGQFLNFRFIQMPKMNVKIKFPENVRTLENAAPEYAERKEHDEKLHDVYKGINEITILIACGLGFIISVIGVSFSFVLSYYFASCCRSNEKNKKKASKDIVDLEQNKLVAKQTNNTSGRRSRALSRSSEKASIERNRSHSVASTRSSASQKLGKMFGTEHVQFRVPPDAK